MVRTSLNRIPPQGQGWVEDQLTMASMMSLHDVLMTGTCGEEMLVS